MPMERTVQLRRGTIGVHSTLPPSLNRLPNSAEPARTGQPHWAIGAKLWSTYSCGSLCGPRHISDPRWLASNLSRRAVADAGGAQWAPPAWDAEAAAVGVGDAVESVALRALEAAAAAGGDDSAGGAAAAAPLLEAYRACAPGKGVRSHRGLSSLLGCARSSWMKNVTEFLTAARNKARGGRG